MPADGNLNNVVLAGQGAERHLERDIEVTGDVGPAITNDIDAISLERIGQVIASRPEHDLHTPVDDAVDDAFYDRVLFDTAVSSKT